MEKSLFALIVLLLVMGWDQSFKERVNHLMGRSEVASAQSTEAAAPTPASTPVAVATPRPPVVVAMPQPSVTPSATPARPKERSVSDIISEYNEALLMVEGDKASGSGFLCTVGGKAVAITNIHVICAAPGFRLTNLKSARLSVQGASLAVGHDVAKLDVDGATKCFDVMENLDANVKIGDGVVILGNAEGARVVKPVEGKVVGIGPNLVEVDAPFVPGNSGSPIVHKATGKVVGIATYTLSRRVDKNSGVAEEPRRFGYRLDSVKTWEPVDWRRFYAQAAQVEKIELLSDDFVALFQNCRTSHTVSGTYQSPAIQRAVQQFIQKAGHVSGPQDRQTLMTRFFDDLRFATRGDIQSFDMRFAYDYFRARVDDQSRLRDAIHADLTHVIDNNR